MSGSGDNGLGISGIIYLLILIIIGIYAVQYIVGVLTNAVWTSNVLFSAKIISALNEIMDTVTCISLLIVILLSLLVKAEIKMKYYDEYDSLLEFIVYWLL